MIYCESRFDWAESEPDAHAPPSAPDSEPVMKYKVSEGDTLFIEKLPVEAGNAVTFDKVLAVIDGDKATFGTPLVNGAKVDATVAKNGKGKKIIVFKYKPKKGYRRKQGHRQPYTKVTIGKISV